MVGMGGKAPILPFNVEKMSVKPFSWLMNGPLKFLTACKFYLCSICSQNLNECSLARAPQIFALLASLQSKFFISACARKKIAVLANVRKDHSSALFRT